MTLKYCPYCGKTLKKGCDCEEIAKAEREEWEAMIERYRDDPLTHEGWAQQDAIDQRYEER